MRFQLLVFLTLTLLSLASQEQQINMNHDAMLDYTPQKSSKPTLADLLTIEQSTFIFYSYARELELSEIFTDEEVHMTVFVPTNKAVMALARKPHQGNAPLSGDIEMSEQEYERISKSNVERWVSAHIVPEFPISFDSQRHNTLLQGKSVTFAPADESDSHAPDWKRVTLEDGIHIVKKKEGLNGVLYIIDGTISCD